MSDLLFSQRQSNYLEQAEIMQTSAGVPAIVRKRNLVSTLGLQTKILLHCLIKRMLNPCPIV
jgi:hypothetical protein